MRVHPLFCAFGGVSITLLGCGSGEPDAPVTIADSAGVHTVTTARAEWTEPLTVELPPATTSLPAPGSPTPLARVLAARRLADGRIAVLDGQLERVVFYDERGRELSSFGRPGQGPGEFARAISIQEVEPGIVEVYDLTANRLTRVERDGDLGRVTTLPPSLPRPSRVWRLDGSSLLLWSPSESLPDADRRTDEGGVWVHRGVLLRVDLQTESADTLFEGPLSTTIRQGERSGTRIWSYPFGEQSILAVGDTGERAFFSSNHGHEIVVLATEPDGPTEAAALLRFPTRDLPIADEELAELAEDARRALAQEGSGSTRDLDFLFDRRLQPAIRPAFQKILVAADGTIWAQRFEPGAEPSPLWWIISSEGAFRGLVRLPEGQDILALDGHALLVLRLDEYDVPSVDVIPMPPWEP